MNNGHLDAVIIFAKLLKIYDNFYMDLDILKKKLKAKLKDILLKIVLEPESKKS